MHVLKVVRQQWLCDGFSVNVRCEFCGYQIMGYIDLDKARFLKSLPYLACPECAKQTKKGTFIPLSDIFVLGVDSCVLSHNVKLKQVVSRAKRKDTLEWVYGIYFCCRVYGELLPYILTAEDFSEVKDYNDPKLCGNGFNAAVGDFHEVMPETLGLGTGLSDKQGKAIIEKDIVRVTESDTYTAVYRVEWVERGFILFNGRNSTKFLSNFLPWQLEVIGNTVDNSELLSEAWR